MSSADLAPEHRVGSTLGGRWRIERLVGVGSVASVYAAMDESSGARVAIKVVHPELVEDDALRDRFLREARLAGSMDHRAIVRVDADATTEDGAPLLAMELLDGERMDARMQRKGGALPIREALYVADAVLDVLAEAHAMGLVHRDVRVANLFLTTDHTVKLMDFGFARIRRAAERKAAHVITSHAPSDEGVVQDDLWAVGAILYTMVTGELVLDGQTRAELAQLPTAIEPPSLREAVPDVPEEVARFVHRAMSFDPQAAWPNARAMQETLHEVIESVRARGSHHPHVASPFSEPLRPIARREMSAGAPSGKIEIAIPKASAVPSEAVRRANEQSASGTISLKWALVVIVLAVLIGGAAAIVLGR
jgi:serine/threonine-protein kinase